MAATKLTDMDRLAVKELIAKLDGRGWSQHQMRDEIRRRLGIDISQPMVSMYRKQMIEEYTDSIRHERRTMVAMKLEQLRDVRREAWMAWERSSEDAEKLTEEWGIDKEEVGAGDFITSEMLIKRIKTREGRLPDNAYLNTILKTLEDERKLLGLDEGKDGVVTVEEVLRVVGALKDAAREVFGSQPELLRQWLQRSVSVLPIPVEDASQ